MPAPLLAAYVTDPRRETLWSTPLPTLNFRCAGIIGWPVSHSRSPLLHGHWLRTHGIAGAYVPLPVAPGRLSEALRGLPALGFAGANVTVPHKEAAARFVDVLDDDAGRIGSVNLITVRPDGRLHGASTDGFGFMASLREADASFKADRGPAVVLGAGGAARAVVAALLEDGAPSIRLLNRTRARAQIVAGELGTRVEVVDWAARDRALDGAALLVNTTTLGMKGHDPLHIDLEGLPMDAMVSDLVYVPRRTRLLEVAARRGNLTASGLSMLMHQARPSFAAWFGVMPDVTDELRAVLEATLA